jgi:YHS domain-containing protein
VSKKTVVLGSVVGVVSVVFVVLVLMAGCQKQKPAAQTQTQAIEKMSMEEHASMRQNAGKAVAKEQTTCPVMGNPINKNIFVEYQGKKVYFCCNGCPDIFKADPEKYLAKLPQFAK